MSRKVANQLTSLLELIGPTKEELWKDDPARQPQPPGGGGLRTLNKKTRISNLLSMRSLVLLYLQQYGSS